MENWKWVKELNVSEGIVKLPKEMKPSKEDWEKEGFVFTEIPDDNIYYLAKMPEGWSIQVPTKSYIPDGTIYVMDNQNRIRGEAYLQKISYKNEPFVPYMGLCTRYKPWNLFYQHPTVAMEHETVFFGDNTHRADSHRIGMVQLFSDEGVLFVEGKEDYRTNDFEKLNQRYIEACHKLWRQAELYGDTHFPNWRDVHAYWDDEKVLSSGNSK